MDAVSMVDGSLDAIARLDGAVRAFVHIDGAAREAAAGLEAQRGAGPLYGLPVGIKDTIETSGLPTGYGLVVGVGAAHAPADDAACIRRLRAAGAVIVGKTVTTELAYLHPGPTRNPWDIRRTPGGSSSGSAAAVAAGMVPLALGTQTGGSVIRPASYCGVFGFKSGIGRTDLDGVHELARSLDTLGWFAASAADLALLGGVLLSPERHWPTCPEHLRLARLRTPFDSRVAGAIHAAIDAVCRDLAAAGAELRDIALPAMFADSETLHEHIVSVEAARAFAAYEGRLSPVLAAFVARGRAASASYEAAVARMLTMRTVFNQLMDDVDALLLPAATGEAPLGLASTGNSTMCLPFSLMGVPCASIPATSGPNGLPLGLQLVGRTGQDEALLALVAWCSEVLRLRPCFAPFGGVVPAWQDGLVPCNHSGGDRLHA